MYIYIYIYLKANTYIDIPFLPDGICNWNGRMPMCKWKQNLKPRRSPTVVRTFTETTTRYAPLMRWSPVIFLVHNLLDWKKMEKNTFAIIDQAYYGAGIDTITCKSNTNRKTSIVHQFQMIWCKIIPGWWYCLNKKSMKKTG